MKNKYTWVIKIYLLICHDFSYDDKWCLEYFTSWGHAASVARITSAQTHNSESTREEIKQNLWRNNRFGQCQVLDNLYCVTFCTQNTNLFLTNLFINLLFSNFAPFLLCGEDVGAVIRKLPYSKLHAKDKEEWTQDRTLSNSWLGDI